MNRASRSHRPGANNCPACKGSKLYKAFGMENTIECQWCMTTPVITCVVDWVRGTWDENEWHATINGVSRSASLWWCSAAQGWWVTTGGLPALPDPVPSMEDAQATAVAAWKWFRIRTAQRLVEVYGANVQG